MWIPTGKMNLLLPSGRMHHEPAESPAQHPQNFGGVPVAAVLRVDHG